MKDKALSKTLFCGKFNLSPEMFEAGLQNEEFYEVTGEDGKTRYSWTTQEHSTARGSTDTSKMVGEEKLAKKQKMLEDAKFESWSIGVFRPAGGGSAAQTPLALQDADREMTDGQWSKAEEHLSAGVKAFDKLEKDGQKCLQTIGVHAKEDHLWQDLCLGCKD